MIDMNKKIHSDHPLIGRWIDNAEDTDAEIIIDCINEEFEVSAHCISDGEQFKIKNILWNGSSLSFDTEMPSTEWKTRHKLMPREDGKVDFELTTFEILKKKTEQ